MKRYLRPLVAAGALVAAAALGGCVAYPGYGYYGYPYGYNYAYAYPRSVSRLAAGVALGGTAEEAGITDARLARDVGPVMIRNSQRACRWTSRSNTAECEATNRAPVRRVTSL